MPMVRAALAELGFLLAVLVLVWWLVDVVRARRGHPTPDWHKYSRGLLILVGLALVLVVGR